MYDWCLYIVKYMLFESLSLAAKNGIELLVIKIGMHLGMVYDKIIVFPCIHITLVGLMMRMAEYSTFK